MTSMQTRTLRRSRDGRVGAGVASGLGRYFNLDPVLFRVLFATAAFFGGAGVIAYLIAWAAIPEEGTERAPIDGLVAEIRRRRVPVWLVVTVAGVLVWVLAFSWWAPGPFLPVLAIVIVLIVVFGRREMRAAPPVDLTKRSGPDWRSDLRGWVDESRSATRRRRARALPVKLTTLAALILSITLLGIVDGVHGIAFSVYFWTALGIVVLGLLVGLVLRRTPWSITSLLIPIVAGTVAFAGTTASLHDGTGDRQWKPTASPAGEYRLAFGEATLDLTRVSTPASPRTVEVRVIAGRIRLLVPKDLNVRVDAHIRFGQVTVDGARQDHGAGIYQVIEPAAGATGPQLTLDVHLNEGEIRLERR